MVIKNNFVLFERTFKMIYKLPLQLFRVKSEIFILQITCHYQYET